MSQIIPAGPYFGFTLAELKVELLRYKEAQVQSGSRLIGATVNGQNFQFGAREGTLQDWQEDLQTALAYLDPGHYQIPGPGDRAVGRPYSPYLYGISSLAILNSHSAG